MALPSAVAKSTVTGRPLGVESETVKVRLDVPASGSPATLSFTDSDGSASSSVIVPVPEPSANVARTRGGEVERERLVDLVEDVGVDGHRHRLRRLAGQEVRSPLVAV